MRWHQRGAIVFWAAFVAFAAGGCKRATSWSANEVDYDFIEIAAPRMELLRGPVGTGKFESEASYVLVDAKNKFGEDLLVTLGGELLDERGAAVGTLRPQSLRIPTGGIRMFALIDSENRVRDEAKRAQLSVKGAMTVNYPPPVEITEGRVDTDQGRAVVRGNVVNTADRNVAVIVIAGFYDASGRPMKRPSTHFDLTGKGQRSVRFVGPEGSKKAYLFVGDTVY
jgi:hypothetical protein